MCGRVRVRAWDRETVGETKSVWVIEFGRESTGERVGER